MTLLLGGGGHARDILSIFRLQAELGALGEQVVVADDNIVDESLFAGTAVLFEGSIEDALAGLDDRYIAATGYPKSRRAVVEIANAQGAVPAGALIHQSACVDSTAVIGLGSVVFGLVWISPLVTVFDHVHIGYGTTIGHDASIGKYSAVMPGCSIGGEVTIESDCLLGANSTVLQGLTIGKGATVGAGAVVTRNVSAGETVVGSPARPLVKS